MAGSTYVPVNEASSTIWPLPQWNLNGRGTSRPRCNVDEDFGIAPARLPLCRGRARRQRKMGVRRDPATVTRDEQQRCAAGTAERPAIGGGPDGVPRHDDAHGLGRAEA